MIIVIDYGLGNIGSILNMIKKVGGKAIASSEGKVVETARKLILPGVGTFDHGMKNLRERNLIEVLQNKVVKEKTPILGLCLGMQLFSQKSEEGELPGLGWLKAETIRFRFDSAQDTLKVPHMGWNSVRAVRPHPLFDGFDEIPRFYFVHSYHVVCNEKETELAQSLYGFEFTSAVAKGNILGTQFHPEKSHRFGMTLFRNFVERI